MIKRKNFLILFDFDGTLIDTMASHINLANKVIVEHFAVSKKWAEKEYTKTTGIPFDKQLEIIFPGKKYESKRVKCAQEYHKKKIKEVYLKILPTKGALKSLKKLQKLGYKQLILTGTEEWIVKKWLKEKEILKIGVFGKEKGIKNDHIKILRKKFPKDNFLIVSDSFKDLILPIEVKIGFYKNKKGKKQILKANPDFLINNLKKLEKILLNLKNKKIL